MQPQAAGHDVAGDIGQPQITCISLGAQPHECIPDAGAGLPGEHPAGLVDLGPAQCQVRGLATRAGQSREVAPGWSWAPGSSTVAASAKISASPSWKAVSGPGRSRYRPSTPGADRPDPQREREDRRRPRLTCRQREDRPAAPGFPAGQIRGQHRAARGSGLQARALPQGQVKLGELLADLISHPHQVTRPRAARGTQPRAGDPNRSHSRRAHIRGRHPAAAAGGRRRDQAPDPARPATSHPRSQRSGSSGWIRPGRLAGSRPGTRATQDGHWPFCAAAEGDRAPAPPACCRGLPCSAPQGLRS